MPASIFIARLLGPIIAIVGIALLVKAEHFKVILKQFIHSPVPMYLAGFFGLLGGIAVLLVHNLWMADWRIVITLIGWLTTVRAIVVIFWPQWIAASGNWLLARPRVFMGAGIVDVLLGLFLCDGGYLHG